MDDDTLLILSENVRSIIYCLLQLQGALIFVS